MTAVSGDKKLMIATWASQQSLNFSVGFDVLKSSPRAGVMDADVLVWIEGPSRDFLSFEIFNRIYLVLECRHTVAQSSELTLPERIAEFISFHRDSVKCRAANVNSIVRLLPFLLFAICSAFFFGLCYHVRADGLSADRSARFAQCLLEVKGTHFVGGRCLFAPLDKRGSFQIAADLHVTAQVTVKTLGHADVSWSGPDGGSPTTVMLGSAYNDGTGCWIVDPSLIPTERTLVCAWDQMQRLFLGPTPAIPPRPKLLWGERRGMNARILSSAGLGTENSTVTAEKDRDGAINWCRQDYDYSIECIERTLKSDGFAPGRTTLHANCKTKKFTDFWGRNFEMVDGAILNLDTKEILPVSSATGSTVAQTAFETLCPDEVK
jgi:hypothetical protein